MSQIHEFIKKTLSLFLFSFLLSHTSWGMDIVIDEEMAGEIMAKLNRNEDC